MVLLGLVLLVLGVVLGAGFLWTLGIVVLLVGIALWVMGSVGHAVGGRRHYW